MAVVFSLLGFVCFAHAAEFARVAYDDAGVTDKEPHLVSGSDWRFENPGTAAEAVRTAVFGHRVEFGYAGLNPKAIYKVKLRFLSDGPREECVKAGDAVVLESVALENGKVTEREVTMPPGTYASGKLTLAIEIISGPNAVVSEIEVFSTDPAQLGSIPLPEPVLPALTPRPTAAPWNWAENGTSPLPRRQGSRRRPHTTIGRTSKCPANGSCKALRSSRTRQRPISARLHFLHGWLEAVQAPLLGGVRLCRAWLNGREVGRHEGGFVPFEFDVTDAIKAGATRWP